MEEMVELALKKIKELEKKLEKYYKKLKIENEIDFINKGTYLLIEDIEKLLNGNCEGGIMDSLDTLKNELLTQKQIIEQKSGVVEVANLNPSPSEITAGLKTIPSFDLTESTATVEDVAQGKTFYSGNAILKTGTATMNPKIMNALFMVDSNEIIYNDEIFYTVPEGTDVIRQQKFYENKHKVNFTFNTDVKEIGAYSFYNASNFTFTNFGDLQSVDLIGERAFFKCSMEGTNFGVMPDSLTNVGPYAFGECAYENMDIRLSPNLKAFSTAAFYYNGSKVTVRSLDMSVYPLATLPSYCFYGLYFNCDFVVPTTVTTVSTYFNYAGCFKNIYINNGLTLKNYAFGSYGSEPVSNYFTESVVFLGETPPSIGTKVFARQLKEIGFKIYVPDTAVEEYKAVSTLAEYADYIHPMSERE